MLQAKRLRNMVENLPAGAVFVQNDRIEINRATEELTGYFRSELTTLDQWYQKVFPSEAGEIRKEHEVDRRGGFPEPALMTIVRKDGEPRVVELVAHGFDHHEVWLLHDVTEPNRIQEELASEKARLESIVNSLPDALMFADLDRKITSCNPAVKRVFGWEPVELIGQPTSVLYANPVDHERQAQIRFNPDLKEAVHPFEVIWKRRDGTSFPGEAIGAVVRNHLDKPIGFWGMIRDITQRKQTENAQFASEQRFHAFMDNSPFLAWMKDSRGLHQYFSPSYERKIGLPPEGWQGTADFDLWPKVADQELARGFKNKLAAGIPIAFESSYPLSDGKIRDWYVIKFPFSDSAGEPCVGGIAIDITDRKSLERHVLNIADEEQARIGRDLHDGLGQELTGLAMMAGSLSLDLQHKSLPEANIAKMIATQIEDSLQHVRTLARGMNPVDIQPNGLHSALSELTEHVSELYGVDCFFDCDQPVGINDSETATNLFRIAQEAITNAVKHGKAKSIRIGLQVVGGKLELIIGDDGVGVQNPIDIQSGMGMRSMRYRADTIGGRISVDPGRRSGTVVKCELPIGIERLRG